MNIAVVDVTVKAAVHFAASWGMTRTSVPLRAGQSALSGYRFDRIILAPGVTPYANPAERDWWDQLLARTSGFVLTTDLWAKP
jgi:hypothetical protein